MRLTDLPGGAARRDDMGVSHAADGTAALAPEGPVRSERALIQAAQRGDPGAVEDLYRRHWKPAYRAAYLVTRDAHAAEDIAQEAFLRAIRVLDRFDRGRPFAPWLHRIVTNRALDWARAHALRRPLEPPSEAVAPEARSDLSEDLAEAIGRLAPDQRAVIVLRYLLEHTPGEIAEMLDLPRGTVNSRLRRALDELAGTVEV
jgi:RNA polymerase sigma-70 factor (ECF subfamily)